VSLHVGFLQQHDYGHTLPISDVRVLKEHSLKLKEGLCLDA
jgi:hypothetical protein